jgi:hypothetical protein
VDKALELLNEIIQLSYAIDGDKEQGGVNAVTFHLLQLRDLLKQLDSNEKNKTDRQAP